MGRLGRSVFFVKTFGSLYGRLHLSYGTFGKFNISLQDVWDAVGTFLWDVKVSMMGRSIFFVETFEIFLLGRSLGTFGTSYNVRWDVW